MKQAATNNTYQSTFLPKIEKANTKIKLIILVAFLYSQSPILMWAAIMQIIAQLEKELPQDIPNREAYTNGLLESAKKMVDNYYHKPRRNYEKVYNELLATKPTETIIKIKNPHDLAVFTSNKRNLWAEAKGTPNVVNYPDQLKDMIRKLGETPITTAENGKKPISVWQKAELDVRYENQIQNLQNLRTKGVRYAYISSHVNASKRCEVFQGCLVSLDQHAVAPQRTVDKNFKYKKSSFIVGKLDGKNVYSLPDIMDVTDPYGYHNNIICGFNCRHRLIPYNGQLPPTQYGKDEVARQREIETHIRELEREIRSLKTQLLLYNRSGIKNPTIRYKWVEKPLKKHISDLVDYYKAYCERNGYAWQKYRIDI